MEQVLDANLFSMLQEITKYQPLPQEQLLRQYECNKTQLKYRISKINYFLEKKAIPPIKTRDGMLSTSLTQTDIETLLSGDSRSAKDLLHNLTTDVRIYLMCVYTFCSSEALSLYHYQCAFNISRNTVISDLKKLKELAESKGTGFSYNRIEGYFLEGPEENIRSLVLYSALKSGRASHVIPMLGQLLHMPGIQEMYESTLAAFDNVCMEYCFRVPTEHREPIIFLLVLLQSRAKQASRPTRSVVVNVELTEKGQALARSLFEALPCRLQEEECIYIAAMITFMTRSRSLSDVRAYEVYRSLAAEIVSRFALIVHTTVADVIQTQLVNELACQLWAARVRRRYGFPLKNPYMPQLKQYHGDLLRVVKMILQSLGPEMDFALGEHEIGFVTIHLMSFETRSNQSPTLPVAFYYSPRESDEEQFLALRSIFPQYRFQWKKSEKSLTDATGCEIVFAAAAPPPLSCPVVPVEGLDCIRDAYMLYEAVRKAQQPNEPDDETIANVNALINRLEVYCHITDYPGLKNLLSSLSLLQLKTAGKLFDPPALKLVLRPEFITFRVSCKDWKHAVAIAAHPLIEAGCILPGYVDSMIDLVESRKQNIMLYPGIALPHSFSNNNVKQVSLSYLHLEQPVALGGRKDKPAKVFIVLAAVDHKLHLAALGELANILADEEKRKRLLAAAERQEVLDVLFG